MLELVKIIRMDPTQLVHETIAEKDRVWVPWDNAGDLDLCPREVAPCSCQPAGTDVECTGEEALSPWHDLFCWERHLETRTRGKRTNTHSVHPTAFAGKAPFQDTQLIAPHASPVSVGGLEARPQSRHQHRHR